MIDIFPAQLLETLVEDRVQKTVAALVVKHRNGELTAQDALSGIATIAALRLLPSDLAERIRKENKEV